MTDRCPWCGDQEIYVNYHDHEWGVPEWDGRNLWELLMLECFQAGLSWITILKKRDAFRQVFEGFDPQRIANWGEPQVLDALANPGIIRHRAKIEATIKAARAYLRIDAQQGFARFIWDHQAGRVQQTSPALMTQVPAQTTVSQQLSRNLKAEGFGFCGPVICYAFMQAAGMVNDHLVHCPAHGRVAGLPQFAPWLRDNHALAATAMPF